jgi:hypothetical protein
MSLEFLLKVLSNENSLAVDCFFLIGLMPSGLYLDDLNIMFGSDVSPAVDKLF